MQNRHTDRLQYFREQEYTTRMHVIPFIESFRPLLPGMRVLEIGCGEGGNLKPFLDRGDRVTGVDISEGKINLARSYFSGHPREENLELICADVYNLAESAEKYDFVLMRDVIEHIRDQEKFLGFARRFMHAETLFFLAFPPWQNPFGGHQQVCKSKILSRLPYFHLLPLPWYRLILQTGGEEKLTITSLLEVRETGLSIERFERIVKNNHYHTCLKQHFLINPNYEIKYKLRPVRQGRTISAIPCLRNYFTTAVYYLLTPG